MWAPFFTKPGSAVKRAVDELLNHDRVALVGPIVSEVLMGFRRKSQADWVASRLRLAHFAAIEWDDWREAATLGRALATEGNWVPLTDLVLATVAKRLNAFVYSDDPHFDLVEGLKRFAPD